MDLFCSKTLDTVQDGDDAYISVSLSVERPLYKCKITKVGRKKIYVTYSNGDKEFKLEFDKQGKQLNKKKNSSQFSLVAPTNQIETEYKLQEIMYQIKEELNLLQENCLKKKEVIDGKEIDQDFLEIQEELEKLEHIYKTLQSLN